MSEAMTRLPSEILAVAATVDPQTVANSEKVSDGIDMSLYEAAVFILAVGDMASETIDFKIEQADDSGFTVNKADLVVATQLAASATANDNSQVVLQCRSEDLADGARYVRGRAITGGVTGGPAAIIGLGLGIRHKPADHLATVKEVKSA